MKSGTVCLCACTGWLSSSNDPHWLCMRAAAFFKLKPRTRWSQSDRNLRSAPSPRQPALFKRRHKRITAQVAALSISCEIAGASSPSSCEERKRKAKLTFAEWLKFKFTTTKKCVLDRKRCHFVSTRSFPCQRSKPLTQEFVRSSVMLPYSNT